MEGEGEKKGISEYSLMFGFLSMLWDGIIYNFNTSPI